MAFVSTGRHDIDMLNGPLLGKIIRFAIPVALSGLLQQLFNAADIAVVGNFAADGALAAVSGNTFVINLMVSLFIGVSVGTNVQMAASKGRNEYDNMVKTLHTSVMFAVICGIALAIIGWFVAPTAHDWLGTGAELEADGTTTLNIFVRDQAISYFRIYFLGMPFIMLYNFASAIFRSKGDTRRPLVVLAISGVLNVLLNLLLVVVFHMSADGVAIATVLSNVFSCAALIFMLLNEDGSYRLDLHKLKIDGRTLSQIVRIGLPAGIQSSMFAAANVILQSSMNALGTDVVAGSGIGTYVEYFGTNVVVGFSQAATSFIGQNYAVGNLKRCRRIAYISLTCGVIGTFSLCAAITLSRSEFISLFIDTNRPENYEIMRIAAMRMTNVGLFSFLNGACEIFSGCMRGMKRSLVPALISVITICGFRLIWIFFFHTPSQGYEHLIICYPLSWIFSLICISTAYFIVRNRVEKASASAQ